MRAGDVIIQVDGRDIDRQGDISRALRSREAGDEITVRVMREGSEMSFDVTLEERSHSRHGMFVMPDMDFSFDFDFGDFAMDLSDLSDLGNAYGFSWVDEDCCEFSTEDMEEIQRSVREAMEEAREATREAQERMRKAVSEELEQRELQRRVIEEKAKSGYEI